MITLKDAPGLTHRLMTVGLMVTIDQDDNASTADDTAAQAIIDAWTVADSIAYVKAQINAHARELRDRVIAHVSPGEMASWPIKLSEAAKFAATGDAAQCPMLSAEAAARGITVAALVAKVGGNAATFSALEAAIGGTDGKHRDAVGALTSFEEIAAYNWRTGWPEV